MDTETLISKVFLKPEVWDKRLKMYSNRVVTDRCWKDISKEMDVPDEVLRKKWKYLRDQFCVEFGKVKPPRSGDPGDASNEPKWPHFKSLMFLKDVVKPRASTSNLTSKAMYSPAETNEAITENFEDVSEAISRNEDTDDDGTQKRSQNEDVGGENSCPQIRHQKRRRILGNSQYNETIIEMEKKKVQMLENAIQNRQTENDDLLFFRSLLPYVKNIPDDQKLRFRSRVQDLVHEFAYSSSSSRQISLQFASPSTSATSYTSTISTDHTVSPPVPIVVGMYPNNEYLTSDCYQVQDLS